MSNNRTMKRTKKVSFSELPQYLATVENAPGYPPAFGDIRDTIAEEFIVEEVNKPKKTKRLSDEETSDWSFKRSTYFRGPAVYIKHIVNEYLYSVREVTDFGNGIAQVCMRSDYAYEIMQENPILRVTGFAFVERSNYVVFSESGYSGLTDTFWVDSAKDEGEHWMNEADVLKDAKHKVHDIRTGGRWTEDYHFPFRKEWESDVFIMEEKRKYYSLSPKENDTGDVTIFSKSVTPPIVSKSSTPAHDNIAPISHTSLFTHTEDYYLTVQRGLENCEENPTIVVSGKKFVFTGLPSDGTGVPVIQWIISHGGLRRNNVSGVTDYLIIGDDNPGAAKIEKALNLRDAGKPIQLIRLEVLGRLIQNGEIL